MHRIQTGDRGRVRLRGGTEFSFWCVGGIVVLDGVIHSPRYVFVELIEEVLSRHAPR